MLATASIKDFIKPSPTEQGILNKFISLLGTYKIRYTLIKSKPIFVVSDLAASKGLDTKDFAKNYFTDGKCILAGSFRKIEGDTLATFKLAWEKSGNSSLKSARSLWITDWRGCYSYLSSGSTQISRQFQELGADSVEAIVSKQPNVVPLHPATPYLKVVDQPEEKIHEAICLLASYTNRHFKREQIVVNTLADETNKAKTRRFDLVERAKGHIRVYELKKSSLTTDHIKETIGEKGYLELAAEKYKNVKLYFVAPSITPSASRLISTMDRVQFIPLDHLVSELIEEVRAEMGAAESEWFVYSRILPQFADVLPGVKALLPAK